MLLGLIMFVAVLALVVALLWNRPFPHRKVYPHRIRRLLEALLKRGYDTSVLRFEVHTALRLRLRHGLRPFIQFRKYIRSPGNCGIEFGFPNAPWSRETFPRIRELVEQHDLTYQVQETASDDTTEFLLVDFGKDLVMAERLAQDALGTVLNASDKQPVTGYLIGISPRDETIC